MPINLIGASNRRTNNVSGNICVFGSMAGLAPTSTVRPHITGIHGYKYTRSAANGTDWISGATLLRDVRGLREGCGFNRNCSDGNSCIRYINFPYTTGVAYYTGSKLLA